MSDRDSQPPHGTNEDVPGEAATVALAVEKYAGFLEAGWEDSGVLGAAKLIRALGNYYTLMAADIERLRERNKELARLLKYAAVHSSLAPHMNDAWRTDSLAALQRTQEPT